MNMQGPLPTPRLAEYEDEPTLIDRVRARLVALRPLLLIVFLPTLLLATYYYGFASDQYQSEAHFIVDAKSSGSAASTSGVGALLGIGATSDQSEMQSVPDYLRSHDAVSALSRQIDLAGMFRRPEVDPLSRLGKQAPAPEDLLKYYKSKVTVQVDHETGITEVRVRAFRPQDAYQILTHLLSLSEQRVNEMNRRSYDDAIRLARQQMRSAEQRVATVQGQITAYRQNQRDVDPKATGQSQIQLISILTNQLSGARAQLEAMGGTVRHDSPQYIAMARQVSALERQVAKLQSGMTDGSTNIASNLGGYEKLQVEQGFVAKQYDAAAAGLQKAQEDALRQQLYLVRVVDANVPVKSLYPQRAKIVLTVFLALLVAYGLGWLIVSGVKEHTA